MSVREPGSLSRANSAFSVVDHFLRDWRLMKKKKKPQSSRPPCTRSLAAQPPLVERWGVGLRVSGSGLREEGLGFLELKTRGVGVGLGPKLQALRVEGLGLGVPRRVAPLGCRRGATRPTQNQSYPNQLVLSKPNRNEGTHVQSRAYI